MELFTLISPDSELFLAENHLHREPTWDCMVKVTQSCPSLCNTRNYTVHGILQDRILEWVAFPFSRGSSQPSNRTQVSHIAGSFFFFFLVLPVYCYQPISVHPRAHMLSHVIPWTSVCQIPLSMDFSRQEYWSGLPFPSPAGGFFTS